MSITFSFTDHGTIEISCGTETIEVLLPHVAATTSNTKPNSPENPAQSASPDPSGTAPMGQKPERIPVRGGYGGVIIPRTMLIVANGKLPTDDDVFPESAPDSALDLADILKKSNDDILASTNTIAGLEILDLRVDHPMNTGSPAIRNLMDLVNDRGKKLDALRIWHK